jgi:hypothetical protein
VRRRNQRVDGQQPKRRRAIDDDMRVLTRDLVQLVLEPEVRIQFPDQPRLELRQGNARGRYEQILERRRRLDDVCQLARRIGDRVVHALVDRAMVEEGNAAVGLRVEIDEECLAATHRQGRGKVDRRRGLAHSTLLVGDGNDHREADLERDLR